MKIETYFAMCERFENATEDEAQYWNNLCSIWVAVRAMFFRGETPRVFVQFEYF